MRHISILVAFLLCAAVAQAKPNDNSGEIHFEKDVAKVDAFPITQDGTIAYFANVADSIQKAGSGTVPAPFPALTDEMTTYLNSVYLYCSQKNGICPSVLDTLLEVDVINARLSKSTQCPTLKKFWTLWVRSDMEKRAQYQTQTGYLAATETFRKQDRPKYIRCEDTVKTATQGFGSDVEFFKNRYGGDSPQKVSVQHSVKVLEEIKEKVHNVISEVGAR